MKNEYQLLKEALLNFKGVKEICVCCGNVEYNPWITSLDGNWKHGKDVVRIEKLVDECSKCCY